VRCLLCMLSVLSTPGCGERVEAPATHGAATAPVAAEAAAPPAAPPPDRCLPMAEGGPRAEPERRVLTPGGLPFTVLVCDSPWAGELILRIDGPGGWTHAVIDPAEVWEGRIAAKPTYGPMRIVGLEAAEVVALDLRMADATGERGSEVVFVFDTEGRPIADPLRVARATVSVDAEGLRVEESSAALGVGRVGGLQWSWRFGDGDWQRVIPPAVVTLVDRWPCDAVDVAEVDATGRPTGRSVQVERGSALHVTAFDPLGVDPGTAAEPDGTWVIEVDGEPVRSRNIRQDCVGW